MKEATSAKSLGKNTKIFLSVTLLAIMLVSGCTIPGTDIDIPWFGGQQTVEYTDDVIIIKALEVTPGKEVKPGQALTLYADVQNLEEPRLGGEGIEVTVELYDYCTTLFSSVSVKCPGGSGSGTKCENVEMQPQEISSIEWILTPKGPKDIKLKTPCTLKVKVTYSYKTKVVTQITFIDENELNSRVRRGEPWKITGSSVIGYGPVKPYLVVESQQPISENVWGYTSLTIKNVGYGYVRDSEIKNNVEIEHENLDMELAKEGGGECKFETTPIKLVNKQSSQLLCKIKSSGDIEIEQTYDMKADIEYDYEFRKSISITVSP